MIWISTVFSFQDLDKDIINNYLKCTNDSYDDRKYNNFRIGDNIYFLNNIWDFNYKNNFNRDKRKFRINFNGISSEFVFYAKLTILNKLIYTGNSIQTLCDMYSELRVFIKDLKSAEIDDIRLLNSENIMKIIRKYESKNKCSYNSSLLRAIRDFIITISKYVKYNFKSTIIDLNNRIKVCESLRPYTSVNQYIPDTIYDQIVSVALKDIDNENLRIDRRLLACFIVILAETGMRIEELGKLQSNMLHTVEINSKKISYLNFYTFKIMNNQTEAMETYTYLHENSIKAYIKCEEFAKKILNDLSCTARYNLYYFLFTGKSIGGYVKKEIREIIDNLDNEEIDSIEEKSKKYLFINHKTGKAMSSNGSISNQIKAFFIRHYNEFKFDNIGLAEKEAIKYFIIKDSTDLDKYFSRKEVNKFREDGIDIFKIRYPYFNAHMFRVTICTKLFVQKVPIDFIRKHMNHLSEDMTSYYNKSFILEDKLYEGFSILSHLTNKDGMLEFESDKLDSNILEKRIEDDVIKKQIEKVNKFLENNKINIKDNLDDIIRMLGKNKLSARENEFGLCIKSIISGICKRYDEFEKQINDYKFRLDLPTYKYFNYSYKRFCEKVNVIKINKIASENDKRFINDFEREINSMKYFINSSLKCEMELIEKDIEKYGASYIVEKFPHLKELIEKYDYIKKEVSKWM